MTTIRSVYNLMNEKAPFALQESWDNSGMLCGHWEAEVRHILTALDITPEVIDEAAALGCDLIVSHHPLVFEPVKSVRDSDYNGRRLLSLIEKGIGAICCHTSLDSAVGGVNDVLAEKCGLTGETTVLEQVGVDPLGRPCGIGRIGTLAEELPMSDYLSLIQTALQPNALRFYDAQRPVKKVAVGGGSCGSMLELAVAAGCDTFVTADLKYDHFLAAKDQKLNLIDAGHYPTENPVMAEVSRWLREAFPAVQVTESVRHREVICQLGVRSEE